jgi:putative ABC transport system permease protein
MLLKIAFRGIFRNTRRSLTTMATIAIGATAVLVFGAYVTYITLGVETGAVQRSGHLTIYRAGYYDFGTGNPAAWGIPDHQALLARVREDAVLKPLLAVATPVQVLAGIAGNFENDTSKTFFGVGFVPSNRDRMKRWNDYGTGATGLQHSGLKDDDPGQGLVGVGLARILGLCERLHLDNCPQIPVMAKPAAANDQPVADDLKELSERDRPTGDAAAANAEEGARIDLLSATTGGAPNVVSLQVRRAEFQSFKELDDNYVGMHLELAQQLVYGRGEHRATGIVLQLRHTRDLEPARARLISMFQADRLDLEVRDFTELTPQYKQVIGLFASIFSFISVIIGVVVLFTVANAMGMSVVERTEEIGTTRALGVRRSGIRRQFLLEGALLGVIGATLGVALAFAVAFAVNGAGLLWTPPGSAVAVPLRLYMVGAWNLVIGAWVGLLLVATLAAFVPANRAARMAVVDALRHV